MSLLNPSKSKLLEPLDSAVDIVTDYRKAFNVLSAETAEPQLQWREQFMGAVPVTLNVIVYQYGKVASTSVVSTLNRIRGVRAHQCHFFGEEAFKSTITRLCNPDTNDYFFDHSLGQLSENLRAYRSYHRKEASERSVIFTVAREPFSWFKSSLLQELEGHIPALKLSLRDRATDTMPPERLITEGMALLIERIHKALDVVNGSIDALTPAKRRELHQHISFIDVPDFEAFLFILSRFLQPHWWFKTQFTPELGVDVADMTDLGAGLLHTATDTGDVYLARYEHLETAFQSFLLREGLPPERLKRINEGKTKAFAREVQSVFESPNADALKARSKSHLTKVLGYHE